MYAHAHGRPKKALAFSYISEDLQVSCTHAGTDTYMEETKESLNEVNIKTGEDLLHEFRMHAPNHIQVH